ncbi:MAG: PSD1 and planctomycete cytochrome C domain-containing protein [Bryobacteraceae bacterium]
MRRLLLLLPLLPWLAPAETRFERDVLPIFTANCFSCHGGTSMAGLDLRTAASTLRGSHQGIVVVKADSGKSLLYRKVSEKLMPPPAFNLKLTEAQIETIKQWIDGGTLADDAPYEIPAEQTKRFEEEAQPVFAARCVQCHGKNAAAGLDLRTVATVLKGSASGPVIVPGKSDKSLLVRRISSRTMPPAGAGEPLTAEQIDKVSQWIDNTRLKVRADQFAPLREAFTEMENRPVTEKDRKEWAYTKPQSSPVPAVKNKARVRTPLDAFVLAKLESKGLTFSPDAPNVALIRRASLDLTGLPPSPDEVRDFVADTRPGAYERLIDRLLASPQYGERWGRHWLDAAGYVDTGGFDNDLVGMELSEGMWRYRDYVVNSFNNDKPYDRFVVEQLAGDELVDWRNAKQYTAGIRDSLTATGYLRCVYDRTDPDIVNLPGERFDVLFHLMEKVSTHLMGLTVGCARCHSHRYDPIPQSDYYRMLSVFTNAYNPWNWKQPKNRFLADVSKQEEELIAKHNADIDRPLARINEDLQRLRKPYQDKLLDAKLAALPENLRADAREAIGIPEAKRDDVQKYLARKLAKALAVSDEDVDKSLSEADRETNARLQLQVKTLESYRRKSGKIQALWDTGPPPVMRLLQRGVVESPGPKVQPGALTVLGAASDFKRPPETPEGASGMRLAFARWLTSRDHPLTARVMVNRVWQDHFGVGIVATAENFGRMGAPPTHPELLDWLAVDFMQNGWTLKRLHKLIMTSTVYRQSSRQPADENVAARKLDPDNHLLWRANLRRLEAEALRDNMLVAAGKLDLRVGGEPVLLKPRADGTQSLDPAENDPAAKWRRSLYIVARRNYPLQLLQVFDFPVMQVNCTRRVNSATPLQSLAMLNDEFVVEQARALATRLEGMATGDGPEVDDRRIDLAYRLVLSRPPEPEETKLCREHLARQREVYVFGNTAPAKASSSALASLCQMLFATNEFLYYE